MYDLSINTATGQSLVLFVMLVFKMIHANTTKYD